MSKSEGHFEWSSDPIEALTLNPGPSLLESRNNDRLGKISNKENGLLCARALILI